MSKLIRETASRGIHRAFVTLILLGVVAALYLGIAPLRAQVNEVVGLLARADIENLRGYLLSFGIFAPLVSGLLMLLQGVIAPLPAVVLTLVNGLLFGTFLGALLSWVSAMAAAILCFYLAKALGRPVAERFTGKRGLRLADHFFETYGKYAVFLGRLIPIVSFDVISYGAGLTRISLRGFLVATGLGMIPATVLYSWLGENLGQLEMFWLWGVLGFSALLIMGLGVRGYLRSRPSGKNLRGKTVDGGSP